MTKASISIDIEVSAEKAWAVVGGYDNLPQWLTLVEASTLEDGGRVRRLSAIGGAVIVERMLSFDEKRRHFSYCHLEAPDPLTDYVAHMYVEALTPDRSRVTWASSFVPAGIGEAEAVAHVEGIYNDGLASLKRLLES